MRVVEYLLLVRLGMDRSSAHPNVPLWRRGLPWLIRVATIAGFATLCVAIVSTEMNNRRLRRSIADLQTFSYGTIAWPGVQRFATIDLLRSVPPPSVAPAHIVMIFGDDELSQNAVAEWAAILQQTAETNREYDITLVSVDGAPVPAPIQRRLDASGLPLTIARVDDPLRMSVLSGVYTLPFVFGYHGERLRCIIAGRGSALSGSRCLSATLRDGVGVEPFIDYTSGNPTAGSGRKTASLSSNRWHQ